MSLRGATNALKKCTQKNSSSVNFIHVYTFLSYVCDWLSKNRPRKITHLMQNFLCFFFLLKNDISTKIFKLYTKFDKISKKKKLNCEV